MFSQSEENYIKAIYSLAEAGNENVSTNLLAERMNTRASSVTDMIRRLAEKELLDYRKYQGCRLTVAGNELALQILRKHRLWESFLVEKLHFGWEEVHEVAEQLEHIQSVKLVNRLDALLHYPEFDPHGDPIPDVNGKMRRHEQSVLLHRLRDNEEGIVVGVEDGSPDFFDFLKRYDINLGVHIRVLETFPFDSSLRVELNGQEVNLSERVARKILVKRKL